MSDKNIINRRLEISDELIEFILCSAFEGGSTYWATNVSCKDNRWNGENVQGQKSRDIQHTRRKQMNKHDEELHRYQTAYDILMDYWDYFPEDMRPEIDKKLKELGL